MVNELRSTGAKALGFTSDVTSVEDADAVVEAVMREWGRIDILVNNAGITQPVKVLNTSVEDW